MLNTLLSEANHGLAIGIVFTIVIAALLFIETPRRRSPLSLRAKLDSVEAQTTAVEEVAVQRMIVRVKSALDAAEKKQMVGVPLVPNQVSGLSHGLSQAHGQSGPGHRVKEIAGFVEPPHTRASHPMLRPLEVHRMLTRIGPAYPRALEDRNK